MPMSSVYVDRLYQQVIADAAEESMKAAVERGKESLTTLQLERLEFHICKETCLYFLNSGF